MNIIKLTGETSIRMIFFSSYHAYMVQKVEIKFKIKKARNYHFVLKNRSNAGEARSSLFYVDVHGPSIYTLSVQVPHPLHLTSK